MKQADVTQWVLNECETALERSSHVSLSDYGAHVGVVDGRNPPRYPYVGVRLVNSQPLSAGIGNGEVYVDSEEYDNTGLLTAITYGVDTQSRYEVLPVTDGDKKLRDDLTDDLVDRFVVLVRNDLYPADLNEFHLGSATTQGRPDEFVRETGIPLNTEHQRLVRDEDPDVAEEVNVDVDVADDIPADSPTDVFDETITSN